MIATAACAAGDKVNNTFVRAIRYTPAVTMVAACISALTGVGPAIASGSQVCSGNCADFPTAPPISRNAIVTTVASPVDHKDGAFSKDRRQLQRLRMLHHHKQCNGHRGIAYTRNDERLAGSGAIGGILIPEAYQEVGAQPHAFPSKIHQQQVVRQHQHQHGAHKEVHAGEEACEVRVVRHIAGGINMDEKAHERDHKRKSKRERIQVQRDADVEIPDGQPVPQGQCKLRRPLCDQLVARDDRDQGCNAHAAAADERYGGLADPPGEEDQYQSAQEGQCRYEIDPFIMVLF